MSDNLRVIALNFAVQSGGVNTATDTIVQRAGAFFEFLDKGAVPEARGTRKSSAKANNQATAENPSESPAADAASTSSASTAQTAAATVEDDFLSEDPPKEPEKKYELKDVRAALVDVQSKVSKETAMEILKTKGGVEQLGALKPEKFATVIDAAKEALKKAGK